MEKYVAYVGTYTHENSVGIHIYDVDVANGSMKERKVVPINNPSDLVVSKDRKFLYSIADEGVEAFKVLPDGDLEAVNKQWIGGMRGCYVEVDDEKRYLFSGDILFFCNIKRKGYCNLCADVLLAFYLNGSFHQLNNGFYDRQPKPCTRNLIFYRGFLSGEFLEDMGEVLLTHANACIHAGENILRLFIIGCHLIERYMDGMSARRIFDCIAHDVQLDFLQSCFIANGIFMPDMNFFGIMKLLLLNIRFKNRIQRMKQRLHILSL